MSTAEGNESVVLDITKYAQELLDGLEEIQFPENVKGSTTRLARALRRCRNQVWHRRT